jgi:hypothetical protein
MNLSETERKEGQFTNCSKKKSIIVPVVNNKEKMLKQKVGHLHHSFIQMLN